MNVRNCLWVVLLMVSSASAEGPFTIEFEELAPGVWTGIRPDGPRFPVMGSTTFVIGDEGVVVFDGGGMPVMSEQVIDKIRSLTEQPVTHVVISHWHGDHVFGIFRFAEEFPGVDIVAHEFSLDVINSSRINYIDRQPGFVDRNIEEFNKIIATGVDSEGKEYDEVDRGTYQQILDDAEEIDYEFRRARLVPPNIVFTDTYDIDLGDRSVELKYMGHGNTEGDIIMWLPDARVVATGDIVVLPTPYAFNVPPRQWAETLRSINALNYDYLVPGHGEIQTDTAYVDLLIEAALDIADQRDALIEDGMETDAVAEALDFTPYTERFTGGDDYKALFYRQYFEAPFRQAAVKALGDGPMVQIPPAESVPFDDERWVFAAADFEVTEYLGQQALRLQGGTAILPELDIKNGLIEFDMAITRERGFAGALFRLEDARNYEHFYVRPHQSGKPDANQYQPVNHGRDAWQLYHGEDYAAPTEYKYDEWMRVRVVYAGGQADIYIDSNEPVLHVPELRRKHIGGAIGLNSASFSAVHFANFKYTQLADAYEFPPVVPAPEAANMIRTWQVSDAFPSETVAGVTMISEEQMATRSWTPLAAEATGITNLAEVQGNDDGNNTVFAMVKLQSDDATLKMLEFGYSDIAAVYLNGSLIYQGNNTYMSRDYRYLGTIGLFDSVLLPLEDGENELCIAVTEAFGGWGVMGRITELPSAP